MGKFDGLTPFMFRANTTLEEQGRKRSRTLFEYNRIPPRLAQNSKFYRPIRTGVVSFN